MTSQRRRRVKRDEVLRYLSRAELSRYRDQIEAALRRKKRGWGLQGWSICGRGDRLRVVVKVPYRRVNPRAAVEPIRIGARKPFLLKVGVEASYFNEVGGTTLGSRSSTADGDAALAPGAPIEVSSGGRSRCGIAAVLDLDGDPFLLTCGHSFQGSSGKVFMPGGSDPVARLTLNLLDTRTPLDAAVCELTPRGLELLDDSKDADTFFDDVHTPDAADNEASVTFWPSSETDPDPIDLDVRSFSTCFDPLFGAGGPRCNFIEARMRASEGDSGSVLAFDDAYYGLCSGTAGTSTYFTAISDVIETLESDFGRIGPWRPD